jgi:hypothetical protein
MRTPTLVRSSGRLGVVSEDDKEQIPARLREEDPRHHYRSRNWLTRFRRVSQTGRNANRRPPVGRCCLVLRGDVDQDVGKMVMVVRQTGSMVTVRWKNELTGEPSSEKMKRPESLIQLEEGLVVAQDAHGMLWIQHEQEE